MILRIGRFLMFIKYARMENGFNPVIYQPLDMTVSKLRRVTLRLGRDRFHPQLIYPSVRHG